MIVSSFTNAAALSLAISLSARASKDVAFHREGILGIPQTKKSIQCATLIFYDYLKCHKVMKQHNNVKFAGHLSMLSEHIKFLAHNV